MRLCGIGETSLQTRLGQYSRDCRGKTVEIFVDHECAAGASQYLSRAEHRRGYDWNPQGERFEDDQSLRLRARCESEHVRRAIAVEQCIASIEISDEQYVVVESMLVHIA